jgi:putative acetyltransferase
MPFLGVGGSGVSEILAVYGEPHLEQVRALLQEYWDSFGFTPCFQGFSEELARLPGEYAPPQGRLGLALVQGRAAGCVALRGVDAERAEAKRLYVRPEFRGQGLGRALLDWVICEARAAGYRQIVGDTMPVMDRALALYDRYGFQRIEPYAAEPAPGAIYLRLWL